MVKINPHLQEFDLDIEFQGKVGLTLGDILFAGSQLFRGRAIFNGQAIMPSCVQSGDSILENHRP